ncbi:hypothetical protein CYY_003036 [Polysphondylium violaceum]|uniref:LIM-type zinc finger-containing protein n=1 Tax=Polysphondylium violaceum TaxID=133409 RepID=A0A8J4PVD9_9MYCE|nr:hypothetical protein CYY_003036 [Polysphondylium violaceum]
MSTPDNCAVCSNAIKSSRVRANGRVFHEDCFICSSCGLNLDSFFFKDGKLYCDPCETKLYAKICDKCSLPIQTTVVNARGKMFHSACFTCVTCVQEIKGGFFYVGGSFVCDSCDKLPKNSRPSPPSPTTTTVAATASVTTSASSPVSIALSNSNNSTPPIVLTQPLGLNRNSITIGNTEIQVPTSTSTPTTNIIYVVNNTPDRVSGDIPPGVLPVQPHQPTSTDIQQNQILLEQQKALQQLQEQQLQLQQQLQQQMEQQKLQQQIIEQQHNLQKLQIQSSSQTTTPNASPTISRSTNSLSPSPSPSTTSTSTSVLSPSKLNISANDLLPPIEKYVPKIQGKTLPELLKNQSFDEILSDVLEKKMNVYNEIKKDEVEFGELMAAGASGKVYRGKYKGRDVAIKVYSTDNFCFSIEEFNREVSIMSLLDHECFTTFYGANKENPKYLFHISEMVKGGCLRDVLLNKDVALSYAQQLSIAVDVAHAMKYLHSLGVIHRDLKSGNVLITDDLRAKVIDFGTSRAIDLSKQMTLNLGTSCWMAPEVFRNEPYTESCDVYSFGIVLWEIYCRADPYDGVNSWSIPVMVCKGERPVIPADCPTEYAKMIKACWSDKAKKRPKFKEIYSTLNKLLGGLTLGKTKKSSSVGLFKK